MKRRLTRGEVNHLRRLLGWANCEVGQDPAAYIETMRKIAPAVAGEVSPQGLARIEEGYRKSESIPQYVRAAIKALHKAIADDYELIEGEREKARLHVLEKHKNALRDLAQ